VQANIVCNVDCDIEVIQQEVEVEAAPPLKKKKQTQEKVLRRRENDYQDLVSNVRHKAERAARQLKLSERLRRVMIHKRTLVKRYSRTPSSTIFVSYVTRYHV